MRKILLLLALFCPLVSIAQERMLTFSDYIEYVRSFHPVAKLADVTLDFGETNLQAARGGFDPRVYFDWNTKRFKDANYYDKRETGVVIPTWGGVELNGLFENNSGTFLNPEQALPDAGLLALGASVNVGQGLFIDRRRFALRQSEIYLEATKQERRQILNDLYLDATEVYWEWASVYQNVKVLEDGVRLAEERFQMVRESFVQGDFPAIDTVEAYTQLLDRIYRLQQAQISLFRSVQEVNTFLWDEDENPIELLINIVPENVLDIVEFEYNKTFLREFVVLHPELRLTDFEIDNLLVERRFKAEMLKPVLKVKYNFLTETFGGLSEARFFENNYNFGLTFGVPLFLRRERGELGFTKAKIDFKNYERDLKLFQLQTKLESEVYNFETLGQQLTVFTNNVIGLQKLLDGEMMMFEVGESSLFLVNAREVSLISAQLTLNDLAGKRKAAYAKMLNAAGLGFDELE